MKVNLVYNDPPSSSQQRQLNLEVPIALGRDPNKMPAMIEGRRVAKVILAPDIRTVSRFHAVIDLKNGQLEVQDCNSSHGTFINNKRQNRSVLNGGDILTIGEYKIEVTFTITNTHISTESFIGFDSKTGLWTSSVLYNTSSNTSISNDFPPAFFQEKLISESDIYQTGLDVKKYKYLAIGAGLGSYIWVDLLRICGAKAEEIIALGLNEKPYARYKQLCLNSQIPLHERLRSNSDSCPDNIWGWPSYALREAWYNLSHMEIKEALMKLWQVFSEPVLIQTYTPIAENVFKSIDRETTRIGWDRIFRYGQILAIRKIEDGRYCIAYNNKNNDNAFVLADYVHLATGYPALKFLPDLQEYRQKTGDFKSVVNAYEDHGHIYEQLRNHGGMVVLRGRGIVASRIVQQIYEIQQNNPHLELIHLMRSPKHEGNKYSLARRVVENHYEFQPFNWPKACWGGELRDILEKADSNLREFLFKQWGGTTTADRRDWKRIVQEGKDRWYQIVFGQVEKVEKNTNNQLLIHVKELDI